MCPVEPPHGANPRARSESADPDGAGLGSAIDAADVGFWSLDATSGQLWATAKMRSHFGLTEAEDLTLQRLEATLHPGDLQRVRAAFAPSLQSARILEVEFRVVHGVDGPPRWIALRGRAAPAAEDGAERLAGCSLDLTHRGAEFTTARAHEERLEAAGDLTGIGFYEVDFESNTMFYDDRLRSLCGFPTEGPPTPEGLGLWLTRLHPEDRDRVLDLREQLHRGDLDDLTCKYRFLHPDRGELWIHHVARVSLRAPDRRATRTFGALCDITVQDRVERERSELGQRLMRAHEDERALLARDLHDDFTQRVAMLAIDLSLLEIAEPNDSRATQIHAVHEGLVRLSEDLHSLSYRLHPSILVELGLPDALRAECEQISRDQPLDIALDFGVLPSAKLGNDAALGLFRVAQEALNNIKRHADARTVVVTLNEMSGGVLLAVRDDGVGFDVEACRGRTTLGLASMRERVELLHGTLDIESGPGEGASIIAWVPLEELK